MPQNAFGTDRLTRSDSRRTFIANVTFRNPPPQRPVRPKNASISPQLVYGHMPSVRNEIRFWHLQNNLVVVRCKGLNRGGIRLAIRVETTNAACGHLSPCAPYTCPMPQPKVSIVSST